MEPGKRIPTLLVGTPPAGLEFLPRLASIEDLPPEKEDFYFLLALQEEESRAIAVDTLLRQDVLPEQIIHCVRVDQRNSVDSLMGVMEILPGDSAEDLRGRLLQRLEAQHHRKLAAILLRAENSGLRTMLGEAGWSQRVDTARLVHAFCCSLDFPPSRHGTCLRWALEERLSTEPFPWPTDLPLEGLLVLSARLALRHADSPAKLREDLRLHAALQPFRTRTDLKSAVERCLASLLKGSRHVA